MYVNVKQLKTRKLLGESGQEQKDKFMVINVENCTAKQQNEVKTLILS